MTQTADILILGGGIAGIGAGAMAAEGAKVVVLEAEGNIGIHATGRSAAIFIRNYGNAALRALNAASAPVLEAPEGISDTSLLSPRGELMFANEAELPALAAYAEGAAGLDHLSAAEACALVPILRRDRVAAAVLERDAQDIDVDRFLQGLARLLRRRGGRIETGAPARSITRLGDLWRVQTPKGVFEAPILINAAGAWADEIAHLAGIAPIGLVPMRRSAAIIPAPDGHDVRRWPLFVPASETFYAKPEAGKLMISPADEDPVAPHDAWPDDMVIAEGLDRFAQAVTVPITRVERTWAGLRSFVPDRTPVVGFAQGDGPRFLWLAGQGGYGVQTAPALSRLAADLCLGRAPALPGDVITALAPARLGRAPAGRAD
jgi:D-arginine dehydrogenase